MTNEDLIHALRITGADQHRCFGCGYEHNCSIHGCAVNQEAARVIEQLARENRALRYAFGVISEALHRPMTRDEMMAAAKKIVCEFGGSAK